MPYIYEECDAGLTKEIRKYYSARYHKPGVYRSENRSETTEAAKRVNQRRAETILRRLMNTNYRDGDFLVRLDFSKWQPIDSIEMQRMISTALRRLKRLYEKQGQTLKYIYVKEVGPRGGRHIHMMINKIDTDVLLNWWQYGGIHFDVLNSEGQYRKIAAYFIKYAQRTEETEGRLIGKRWYGSQNLDKPKVRKKIIQSYKFKNKVKEIRGFYLDKETLREGVTDEGFDYFEYTLIALQERGPNEG